MLCCTLKTQLPTSNVVLPLWKGEQVTPLFPSVVCKDSLWDDDDQQLQHGTG
jgi:hypothetical protein